MANVTKWSNVAVAVQSALAVAVTVTAITKANPGVVSATAHGYTNGDYVLLTVLGMTEVNGRVFRISGSTAGTFNLEGEDTTLHGTFTSGSSQKVTFGTTMTTATGLTASGGEFDFIDTTTIHDKARTQIPGLPSPATYSFESIWDVADTALIAFKAAAVSQAQRCVRFTFANGQIVAFNGYVAATLLPGGNAQDKVTTPVVVTMFGAPTTYAV